MLKGMMCADNFIKKNTVKTIMKIGEFADNTLGSICVFRKSMEVRKAR